LSLIIIIIIIIIIIYNEDMEDYIHSAVDALTVKLNSLTRICFILNMQAFWNVT